MKKTLAWVAILVAAGTATFAQPAPKSPVVIEPQSGQLQLHHVLNRGPGSLVATGKVVGPDSKPQAGVPLEVDGPGGKTSVFTDSTGTWFLYNLPSGTYQLHTVAGNRIVDPNSTPTKLTFTVKQKGWFDFLKSTDYEAHYAAPTIKLDKPFGE